MTERADRDDYGEFLDAAAEEAPQALFDVEGVKLDRAEEFAAIVAGPALKAIAKARIGLLVKGHTPENDEMLPIGWLPMEAMDRLGRVQLQLAADDRDLSEVRRLLAESAAFAMAALDWLDRAGV